MKNTFRRSPFIYAVATAWCCTMNAVAQNSIEQINVDQLTQQWLKLEKSASQLSQNWQLEKQQLTLRISLLSHQNKVLREKISNTNNQKDQVNQQRQEILTAQTLIEQDVELYQKALPSLIDQSQQLMSGLPLYLSKQLTPELDRALEQKELTGKYQAIANIVKAIEKNRELIQVKQGVIQLESESLLTQQLYMGHDQAWFITQDNSRAGIGYRQNNQWQWREKTQSADDIRQAIVNAKNQMPGPLLSLPIYLDAEK